MQVDEKETLRPTIRARRRPGKIVRLNPKALKLLNKHLVAGEAYSHTIIRLLEKPEPIRETKFSAKDKMKLFLRDFIVSNENRTGFEFWVSEAKRILKFGNKKFEDKLMSAFESSQENPMNYGPSYE